VYDVGTDAGVTSVKVTCSPDTIPAPVAAPMPHTPTSPRMDKLVDQLGLEQVKLVTEVAPYAGIHSEKWLIVTPESKSLVRA